MESHLTEWERMGRIEMGTDEIGWGRRRWKDRMELDGKRLLYGTRWVSMARDGTIRQGADRNRQEEICLDGM